VCCGERRFEFLEGGRGSSTASLCGRNAIQIATPHGGAEEVDLAPLAARLEAHGPVTRNEFMVRADLRDADRDYRITLFPDGRAVVFGTDDPATAKSIYARYVGA
jgi:adenylyltransferase/sulfurtransferase